jgi:hypothetical protein
MMGKGSNRREFNKERERAFVKNHKRVYGTSTSKSSSSSAVYVIGKNGELVPKPPKGIQILPIPPTPNDYMKQLEELRRKVNYA